MIDGKWAISTAFLHELHLADESGGQAYSPDDGDELSSSGPIEPVFRRNLTCFALSKNRSMHLPQGALDL